MRIKITVLSVLIVTGILCLDNIGIACMNLIAFCAVQALGFLLSLAAKKAPRRAGIRFAVSAAAVCAFLILGTNRRHLWSLYFLLSMPACGLSVLIDLFAWIYEKCKACAAESF